MTQLNSITLRNFLSVGNVTQALKLSEHGLTLVLGQNNDSNGTVTKNGAGKTTLLQAISFAIYGQPLTKIKVDNLINNINQRGMVVTLDFERGGVNYRIERGRKPNILRFYANDKEIVDNNAKGENAETQIDIEAIFGMSHMMFKHIVALNTFTDPFLKLKAAEQREVIEELLGVTQISARAETLKKFLVETKSAIQYEDAAIKGIKDANANLERSIAAALSRSEQWEAIHVKNMEEMREELRATDSISFDEEFAKFDAVDAWQAQRDSINVETNIVRRETELLSSSETQLRNEIRRIEREIQGADVTTLLERMDKEIWRKEESIKQAGEDIVSYAAKLEEKNAELSKPGELDCRTCGQVLEGTSHLEYVVSRLTEDRDALATKLSTKEKLLETLKGEKVHLNEEYHRTVKEASERVVTLKESLASAAERLVEAAEAVKAGTARYEAVVAQGQAMGPKPETMFNSREEVYAIKHAQETLVADLEREINAVNPFQNQIDTLSEALQKVDLERMNELTDLLKHQDFLMKLLTSKESFIRKKIIEQNLSYLNIRLNGYLNKLGLPHEVVFQSDLSVEIVLLGRDFDFAQLSRGEMNRVILATSWAFRDVWESLNHGLNLLAVDELIDNGTDSAGAEAALQVLKAMARDRKKNIFLISHRDELVGRIDRTLTVKKENGFSTLELT